MNARNNWKTLALSAGLTATLGTAALAADDVLKIGMPVAQTEMLAVFDQPAALGFMLGVEEINASGGIDGKIMIEVTQADTRSETAQSMLLIQEMIDDGVDVIMMSSGTADVVAAGPLAAANEILTLTYSSNPGFAAVTGDFVKTLAVAYNQTSAAAAIVAAENLGAKTAWLLVSPDDPYTAEAPRYFANAFEKLGGTIAGEGSFSLFQQEFGSTVQEIRSLTEQPDVIFTHAFEPDFPIFVKQARAAGITSYIMSADGVDTPTIYGIGPEANGVVHMTLRPSDMAEREVLKPLIAAVEEMFGAGSMPDSFAATGYLTALMLAEGVKQTGSTDSKVLKEWMSNLENHNNGMNLVTFKGMGSTPLIDMHWVEVKDGAAVPVRSIMLTPDQIEAPGN